MAHAPLRRSQIAKPLLKADAPPPGFFGKLPMRGDFVLRRFNPDMRMALDSWLSASITASRKALGEAWPTAYEHAPLWRFVFASGVAGPEPMAGVLMPNADSFGRQFPLIVGAGLPGCTEPFRLFPRAEAWFAAAERAARSASVKDADFAAFDSRVQALGLPPYGSEPTTAARRFAMNQGDDAFRTYASALEAALSLGIANVTLWWTEGGGTVEPSLLFHRGLPAPERFAAFLDGAWEDWGWSEEHIALPPVARTSEDRPLGPIRSASRTHCGTRRNRNEDAALEYPELGLWAVADGAGGHDAGSFASGVVIAKLAEFLPAMSFGGALTEIEELLGEANQSLCARGRQLGPERIVASVVVVLFIHDGQYAVVWAGDSRAYLLREGRLESLTRDHVSDDGNRYVTRAIGAQDGLQVDIARGDVMPGDRFILCSDGLVNAVGETGLAAAIMQGTSAEAVFALIDDALIAGAGDNITALVVDIDDALCGAAP